MKRMKFLSKTTKLGVLVFGLALSMMTIATVVNSNKAAAAGLISNVAPIANSGCIFNTGCATQTQPWFAVGTGQYNGAVSYAKIYVPVGTTASLTIQNGGGVCPLDVGSPRVDYEVADLSNTESFLSGTFGGSPLGQITPGTNVGKACGAMTLPLKGGISSNVPGHSAYKVYYFQALIQGMPGDNEKNFRLAVSSGYVGVSAPVRDYGSAPWFGIYQRDAPAIQGISNGVCDESSPNNQNPNGCNWNWSVNYGPRCDEDATPKTVSLYDIDYGVYAQPYLRARVLQDSRNNGGAANWVNPPAGGGNPTSRYGPAGEFNSGSGVRNDLSWTSDSDHRYGIFFQDVDWHNTIQISLPFDQFDGSDAVKCPAQYVYSCTTNPASQGGLAPNTVVNISVTAKNLGANTWDPSSGDYKVHKIVNGVDQGNVTLSSVVTPNANSPPFAFTGTSPPTQGTKTLVFKLYRNGVEMTGTSCNTRLTTGSIATGNAHITADCGNTYVDASVPTTWHPTAITHSGVATRIDFVPAAIVIYDDATNTNITTYLIPGGIPNDGAPHAITGGTFGMSNQMWLHKAYRLELAIQGYNGGDSFTYNNNGDWNPTNNANDPGFYYGITTNVDSSTVSDCMDAYCGSSTPVDMEPGQSNTFNLGITIVNRTSRGDYSSNDPNGYNFTVTPNGGLTNVSGISTSPGTIVSGSAPIDTRFNARLDYQGGFTVSLNFGGSPMTLTSLNNPCPSLQMTPATRPFFEVRAGDLSTGGGFTTERSNIKSCADTAAGDSPYISPSVTGYAFSGGVRAFSSPTQARGSFVRYGGYSLGLTVGTVGGPIGFYSGDVALFADKPNPDAAFTSLGTLGYAGYLNSSPPAHCTPVDFYNSTRTSGTTPGFSGDLTTSPGGQYQATGNTTLTTSTIGAGKQITLYVDGDLTIDGDIKYDPNWDPNVPANIPYLVVIVKGNITLTDNTKQLDGLYIAQPDGTNGGSFQTCDPSNFCGNQLVVNGAIIAQQVDLLRAHGSLGPCDPASPSCQQITGQPGEVVNFSPSMIIGLPALLQKDGGAIIPSSLEGIFSLPPVF